MSRTDVDRLAALLEADPDAAVDADADARQLAVLAQALRDTAPEAPAPRPEFRAELRAQVIAAAREQRPEVPLLTRLRDGARRMRYSTGFATGTGLAAVALTGGGVAGAAELAGPGDLLYGVKLGIEDVRLDLTFDEAARGQRAMSYAFDRVAEAADAAEGGRSADAAAALDGASTRVDEATDAVVASGLVEPALALTDDLAALDALVAELTPLLEGEAATAASGLQAALGDAAAAVADVVVPGVDPVTPPAPLPDLELPSQEAPAVPDPATTAPAADGGTQPAPTPQPVPTPQPAPTARAGGPLGGVTDGLGDTVDGVGAGLGDTLDGVQGGVEDTLDGVGDALDGQPDAPAGVLDGLGGTLEGVGDGVEGTVDGLGDGVEGTVDGVGDVLEDVLGPSQQAEPTAPGGNLGGTVDDVLDGVGGTADDLLDGVGGIVGGLLGGGS